MLIANMANFLLSVLKNIMQASKVDTNGRCSYAWTSVVGHATGNVYLYRQSCMMASQ